MAARGGRMKKRQKQRIKKYLRHKDSPGRKVISEELILNPPVPGGTRPKGV